MLKIKCRKCRAEKDAKNVEYNIKNNKNYVSGECETCGSKFHRFCKKENNIEETKVEPVELPNVVEVKQKTKKVKKIKEEVKN